MSGGRISPFFPHEKNGRTRIVVKKTAIKFFIKE
jgi:hypothetical protein